MGPYSLPLGHSCSHHLKCCFTLDGLSRAFLHGRVVYKRKFVELPLILRGHSLGQSKDFDSLPQLDLLMSLVMFYLVVLISLSFWWLALHEFKKFQKFCDFCTLQKSGMLQTTTVKRNLVPRFGKARKRDRFR